MQKKLNPKNILERIGQVVVVSIAIFVEWSILLLI
jgi:hypothetical protein